MAEFQFFLKKMTKQRHGRGLQKYNEGVFLSLSQNTPKIQNSFQDPIWVDQQDQRFSLTSFRTHAGAHP